MGILADIWRRPRVASALPALALAVAAGGRGLDAHPVDSASLAEAEPAGKLLAVPWTSDTRVLRAVSAHVAVYAGRLAHAELLPLIPLPDTAPWNKANKEPLEP